MVDKKECEHERILPLYVRDQDFSQWYSSKKITGEMIYMCLKCGKIFRIIDKKIVKKLEEVKE